MGATKDAPGEITELPSLEYQSLESEATKLLSEKDFSILKAICVAIGKDGMTTEEACQLSNIKYETLRALCEQHDVVRQIIALKELEYKRSLLKTLSARARSGDDKVSQWLLERRYPDEFGTKKKAGDGTEKDSLAEAIAFIQERGDSTGIINRRTVIITAPKATTPATSGDIKRLQEFLT